MRAVVQRVSQARVSVDDDVVGQIGAGLCLFVGVMDGDEQKDVVSLAKKVSQLRIFEDGQGKMNQSVLDTGGAVLSISQFTLAGDVRKGNRPTGHGQALGIKRHREQPARKRVDEMARGQIPSLASTLDEELPLACGERLRDDPALVKAACSVRQAEKQ